MTRKHTVAFTEPSPDDVAQTIVKVQSDNPSRVTMWATFRLPSEAHAGCASADLDYVDGIMLIRPEGLLVKVVFLKSRTEVIVKLVLGHRGRYAGPFRMIG